MLSSSPSQSREHMGIVVTLYGILQIRNYYNFTFFLIEWVGWLASSYTKKTMTEIYIPLFEAFNGSLFLLSKYTLVSSRLHLLEISTR